MLKMSLGALLGAASLLASAASGAPLDASSLLALQFVEDVEISSDGRRIVYELSRIDAAKDKYERDLWLIDGDSPPRPFVSSPGDDSRPRWSPDGKRLAFVSTRAGAPQLFILEMTGGEAWRLTDVPQGVDGFAWSPDSSRIAYLARTPTMAPPAPQPGAAPGAPPAAPDAKRALITDRLFYRMDGFPGFLPGGRSQIFVIEVRTDRPSPRGPLTDGHTQPSTPAWSPDGRWLTYSTVPPTWQAETENDAELYRVSADGQGAPVQLTSRLGPDENPIVDASTGLIAWSGFDAAEPRRMATTQRLYVMRPDQTGRRELTSDFDRNVGEVQGTDAAWLHGLGDRIAFAPKGDELLFLSSDRGITQLYRVGVRGGKVTPVANQPRGDLREVSVARNGKLAAIFGSPTRPYEIWTAERAGGAWRQRTNHALSTLSDPELAAYEPFDFDSFDGRRIQGWLVKPPRFDASRKYPLILYAHGGPNAMYGENFYHEFQVLANAGYVVMLTNPRGSTGYGQAFANETQHRHPIDGSQDLIAAADAVAKLPYIDEKRLGIAGGSAGGTLAAWTIGKTRRFAAALVERPATNWFSFQTNADVGVYFAKHWFTDFPWRRPDDYLARSPIAIVDEVQTPVLVIQSTDDYRTTADQGLGYYGALKMLGKDARLALFPMSSHSLSRNGFPSQRLERLEVILKWFDEKLKPGAAAASAASDRD